MDVLDDYIDNFYSERRDRINEGKEEPLQLFKEDIFRPENAKTEQQQFLIYHHLYHHWLRWMHENHKEDVGAFNLLTTLFSLNFFVLTLLFSHMPIFPRENESAPQPHSASVDRGFIRCQENILHSMYEQQCEKY